jgi:hypothetical protein
VRVAGFRYDRIRREGGAALFVTALILMLVGMLAVTAIYSSERESVGGARSRSTARTFYAADAGIQLALSRLAQTPPDLTSFDVDLAEEANVQSRTREQAAPQPIEQVGVGAPPEGYSLNVGSGGGYVSRVYRVNATARAGGSTVELEAKLSRTEPEAGGY